MSNGDEEPAEDPDQGAPDAEGSEPEDSDAEVPDGEDSETEATEAGDSDEESAGEESEIEGPSLSDALESVEAAIEGDDVGEEELDEALDAAETAVEAAETEADLDEVESAIDDVEAAIESADLPEPEDEDEESPREALEVRVVAVREDVEAARGPYASDVVEVVETARSTVTDTRWTDTGEEEVAEAVETFVDAVNETLDADLSAEGDELDALAGALEDAGSAVEEADLDPDDDAETIAALVEAAEALAANLDAAEAWEDLTTREKLDAQGFYDVLGHTKDYPPEWSALKEHEKRGDAEMVLLALESLGSEFMEEHCLDALRRMAPEEAIEPMLTRADRRDRDAIEILGKIGSDEAIETIVEYVDTDSDPLLQKTTLKALGEIGSTEATQAVANKLVAENERVRSYAARAIGMIGDTRAVDPLADVLADDESDTVRASAAWALVQIGTEDALEVASEHADDRAYIVSVEAERAAEALGAKPA